MNYLIIEMPNEDERHSFSKFNKAISFCEKEFGYGKTIEIETWKGIKKSKNLLKLKDFLWQEGLWVELKE